MKNIKLIVIFTAIILACFGIVYFFYNLSQVAMLWLVTCLLVLTPFAFKPLIKNEPTTSKKIFVGFLTVAVFFSFLFLTIDFAKDHFGYKKISETTYVTFDGYDTVRRGPNLYKVSNNKYTGLQVQEDYERVKSLISELDTMSPGQTTAKKYKLTLLEHSKIVLDAEIISN